MKAFVKPVLSILIFGSFVCAEDYVIEAKGEFGKELKALIEKYAKESNASVNIYEKEEETHGNMINIGVNKNKKYNAINGEKLYNKNCKNCHGKDGNTRAMGESKRLKSMSGEDIADAMAKYSGDSSYGGRLKYLMHPVAERTSYNQVGDIIAYLKGDNALTTKNAEEIEEDIKDQGSYLK